MSGQDTQPTPQHPHVEAASPAGLNSPLPVVDPSRHPETGAALSAEDLDDLRAIEEAKRSGPATSYDEFIKEFDL